VHHFITGVAGFIGSQLADALIARGDQVSGIDDYSLGRASFLDSARASGEFHFTQGDCSDEATATDALRAAADWAGVPDIVWHMAANSDIQKGVADARVDFKSTLGTTFATLEAAKMTGVKQVAFASSSAVYGEHDAELREVSGPLLPISNYGAAKLGSEAMLSAAAESFLDRIWIFRFPNVVGPRATHGAILDFIRRLSTNAKELRVLGDGSQMKPYLHVSELIAAMLFITGKAAARRNLFNIAPQGTGTSVRSIAEQVVARKAPGAGIVYTGGDRGWLGDVPHFRYATDRLAELGWRPKMSSDEAVLRAIGELVAAHV
jgi:UDP-glucose 4-epimerase